MSCNVSAVDTDIDIAFWRSVSRWHQHFGLVHLVWCHQLFHQYLFRLQLCQVGCLLYHFVYTVPLASHTSLTYGAM